MKVTLERAALLKALGHVYRIVERRNTIPILANVLVEADKDGLLLKGTDLSVETTERAPAEVAKAGATTVAAHILFDIVGKLPDGAQVSLEADGDASRLTLRSGRSRFQLQCLPASDFPALSAGDMPHRFELEAAELGRLIDKTQFAISQEETRYYLNGIYLHVVESSGKHALRAVATDGHRLARVETPAPKGAVGMPGVIVPRKAVGEVRKLLADAEGTVTVEVSPTKARFVVGSAALTTKLIDGTYPDYARVIPQGNDKRLVVEKQAFKDAVDRVSTVSSDRGRAVKLAVGDGKMTLSVNNPDSGSATEEIEVDYDSTPIEIGFNSRYLLDIAAQVDGDTALVRLADSGSPTLFQDRDGASALFVLMPMRV